MMGMIIFVFSEILITREYFDGFVETISSQLVTLINIKYSFLRLMALLAKSESLFLQELRENQS